MAVYAAEPKLDVTYIWLEGHQDTDVTHSVDHGDVIIDFNSSGVPVGIEILERMAVISGLAEQQHSDDCGVQAQ